MVMLVSGGVFTATGDDPPFTLLPPDQRLAYSELVCSATIVDNQLTGRTMNFGSLTTAENMARADVDSVFKGSFFSTVTRKAEEFGMALRSSVWLSTVSLLAFTTS